MQTQPVQDWLSQWHSREDAVFQFTHFYEEIPPDQYERIRDELRPDLPGWAIELADAHFGKADQ